MLSKLFELFKKLVMRHWTLKLNVSCVNVFFWCKIFCLNSLEFWKCLSYWSWRQQKIVNPGFVVEFSVRQVMSLTKMLKNCKQNWTMGLPKKLGLHRKLFGFFSFLINDFSLPSTCCFLYQLNYWFNKPIQGFIKDDKI